MAEWLGNGLQNRLQQFDSARHLIIAEAGRFSTAGFFSDMFNTDRVIQFTDIGEVTFHKSYRAKNYRIKVDGKGSVTVTVPLYGSWRTAVNFVKDNKKWILSKQAEKHNQPPKKSFSYEELKKLADEAYSYIPARITELSEKNNLPFASLRLSTARTRWGSCSFDNRISISIYTMLLPENLIDFILLHELTHTIHKNHQAGFHAKLNELTGGKEKELSKELRTVTRTLNLK